MIENLLQEAENTIFHYPDNPNTERNWRVFTSIYRAFILVYDESKNGLTNQNRHSKILEYLNGIVAGGNEICTDSRINWHYPLYSATIAIVKNTPTIWNDLNEETKNKITLIMKCLLVTTNFISCDNNNYKTGIGLTGDVQKNWNPNVQMSLVMPIVFLDKFFGGHEAIDNILTSFDYGQYIEEIKSAKFTNILNIWTTPDQKGPNGELIPGAEKLLTLGRKAYLLKTVGDTKVVIPAAGGQSVKKPYLFKEMNSSDKGIFTYLLTRNYSGGPIASSVYVEYAGGYAHTVDNSVSPYEGQNSMLLEFLSSGNRSCAHHSAVDFCIATGSILSAFRLGILDGNFFRTTLYKKIKSGNGDLFYKLEHGWHGYTKTDWRDVSIENLRVPGYNMMKTMWEEELLK